MAESPEKPLALETETERLRAEIEKLKALLEEVRYHGAPNQLPFMEY